MFNALIGDCFGAWGERQPCQSLPATPLPPSDDSYLTLATARALLVDPTPEGFARCYQKAYHDHPKAGFGAGFAAWAQKGELTPNPSWGNGCVMRVSPIAAWARSLEEALTLADASCALSHAHADAKLATRLVAGTGWLWRRCGPEAARAWAQGFWPLPWPSLPQGPIPFDARAVTTAPLALGAAFASPTVEATLRLVLTWGGDCDTLAATACGLWPDLDAKLFEAVAPSFNAAEHDLMTRFEGACTKRLP